MARFLRLAPGLYLVLNGGLLLASPGAFVRVHTLPFYPPSAKQAIGAIGTHEGASRLVGLAATVAGVAWLLVTGKKALTPSPSPVRGRGERADSTPLSRARERGWG